MNGAVAAVWRGNLCVRHRAQKKNRQHLYRLQYIHTYLKTERRSSGRTLDLVDNKRRHAIEMKPESYRRKAENRLVSKII